MSPARPRRRVGLLLAAVSASLALGTVPAQAAPGGVSARPVPVPDGYRVLASGTYRLPVLANDEVGGLFPGELTLCGVSVDEATSQALYVEIDRDDPAQVYLEVSPSATGLMTFSYDACEGRDRATVDVVLDVVRLEPPVVRKARKRRGQVVATNPNDVRVILQWGSNRTSVADGQRTLPPGRRVRIPVQRTRVYWVAYLSDQGAVVTVGDGTVSGIKRAGRRGTRR